MSKNVKEIKSNNSLEGQNKNNKCPCNSPKWIKWLVVILIIAIFIIVCVQLHYLWKLSDIWNAVKNTK